MMSSNFGSKNSSRQSISSDVSICFTGCAGAHFASVVEATDKVH